MGYMLDLYRRTFYTLLREPGALDNATLAQRRLHFGLCGIMKLKAMETKTEEFVRELFPSLIASIESRHGFEEEETRLSEKGDGSVAVSVDWPKGWSE
jgi:hypothetical protein